MIGKKKSNVSTLTMNKSQPAVDIILDILKAMLQAKPDSVFIKSLYQQYCERGGLSKKQLEGLHSKALKAGTIKPGKLATLQAIILKRPTRYKSTISSKQILPKKDEVVGKKLEAILLKYPQHKAALFLKSKYDSGTKLAPAEIAELEKFCKILL